MTYRVLSLDGGGAWALLQARALEAVYGDIPGRAILARFDLAVANSGGSIVLGGLVENKSPTQIADLFLQQANRAAIFAKTNLIENLLSHIPIFPRYSAAGKLRGLTNVFGAQGATPLSAFSGASWVQGPNGGDVKLMIAAFHYDEMRAALFRSYGTAHGATANDIPLVQAVHASSDAPVEFFDAPTVWAGHRYWDGAMAGLNNPLLAGVIDLMGEGVRAQDIVCLSLGTGTVRLAPPNAGAPAALTQATQTPGVISDLGKAAGCITDDPPDMASFTTHVMLASARDADPTALGWLVRLSPMVTPLPPAGGQGWVVPPGLTPDQFHGLATLSMDAVEQDQVALIDALATCWIQGDDPINQPIRVDWDDPANALGERTFSAAKARWLAIS
ncbi:patatin-like phospholipase family protein [Caulobacter sp. KR2-114]|uniref:patatin-like phospholipase family protein n=1 Tax=Caulobacter sp. KR2-114 TaxID=3400912 RepID=UPI003C036381